MPRITALTADTSPTYDDLIVTVNSPSGIPANKKVTIGNLFEAMGYFNVRAYGAIGNGVADDTAAILAAIAALPALGGTVYFPSGSYLITDTIHVTKDYVTLLGSGFGSVIRMNHATKDMIHITPVDPVNTFLSHFRMEGFLVMKTTTPPSAGAGIRVSSTQIFELSGMRVVDNFYNIQIEASRIGFIHDMPCEDTSSLFTGETPGSVGLVIGAGVHTAYPICSSLYFDRVYLRDPIKYRQHGIYISSGDSLFFDQVYSGSFYHSGLTMAIAPNLSLAGTLWTNCQFDSIFNAAHTLGTGVSLEGAASGGGIFLGHIFIGCGMFNGSGTYGICGVDITTGCSAKDIRLLGGTIGWCRQAGALGVNLRSTDAEDILIDNNLIVGNESAGIKVIDGISNFRITNNKIGQNGQPSQLASIVVGANCSRFVVMGNQCKYNTSNTIVVGSSPTKYVLDHNEDSAD